MLFKDYYYKIKIIIITAEKIAKFRLIHEDEHISDRNTRLFCVFPIFRKRHCTLLTFARWYYHIRVPFLLDFGSVLATKHTAGDGGGYSAIACRVSVSKLSACDHERRINEI